jgi:hypothetical protein
MVRSAALQLQYLIQLALVTHTRAVRQRNSGERAISALSTISSNLRRDAGG